MKIDVNHVNSRKKDVEVKLEDTWRQYNEDLQTRRKSLTKRVLMSKLRVRFLNT